MSTIPDFKNDYTRPSFRRKHYRVSKFTQYPGVYHPDTQLRIVGKGLTPELMELANRRRQLLAYRRIHRARSRLVKVRVGYISIREIAAEAKANCATVREALRISPGELSLQLYKAFLIRTFSLALKKETLSVRSASPDRTGPRKLREAMQRCAAKALEPPRLQENAALRREKSAGAPLTKGEGASIRLNVVEADAFIRRKTMPGRWQYQEERIRKRLQFKKNGFKPDKRPPGPPVRGQNQRIVGIRPANLSERQLELEKMALEYWNLLKRSAKDDSVI